MLNNKCSNIHIFIPREEAAMSAPTVPFARSGQQVASSPGSQVSLSPTLVSYPQNDRIIQDISGKLFSNKRELFVSV